MCIRDSLRALSEGRAAAAQHGEHVELPRGEAAALEGVHARAVEVLGDARHAREHLSLIHI